MGRLQNKIKLLLVLLCAVAGWGVYAYLQQLRLGLGVTGLNRPVFWGLYIINFVFLIGVSAGGLAVSSLAHLARIEKYKPVARIAEIVAVISLSLAMLSILFDIGRPDRMFNLFLYPQITSPLTWDFFIINIYMVLCLLLLGSSIFNKPKLGRACSFIAIPAFVLVHSVTAWIFGFMKAKPGWHTALLAPLFICSALVSGLALVILAILFCRRAFKTDFSDDVIIGLGKFFRFLLPVLFYFLFCDAITVYFASMPSHLAILKETLQGRFAYMYWFDITAGIVAPFLLSITPLAKTAKGVGVIALLALLGVFAERIDIVLPSFHHLFLINTSINYMPTWTEWSIVAGVYALGFILFIIVGFLIPLKDGGR